MPCLPPSPPAGITLIGALWQLKSPIILLSLVMQKILDLKWFLSHNVLFTQMALTDLGSVQKMIDEYSFLLISRDIIIS